MPQNRFIPSTGGRKEVRPLRGPAAHEDSRPPFSAIDLATLIPLISTKTHLITPLFVEKNLLTISGNFLWRSRALAIHRAGLVSSLKYCAVRMSRKRMVQEGGRRRVSRLESVCMFV
jgi:hypothetical protein